MSATAAAPRKRAQTAALVALIVTADLYSALTAGRELRPLERIIRARCGA